MWWLSIVYDFIDFRFQQNIRIVLNRIKLNIFVQVINTAYFCPYRHKIIHPCIQLNWIHFYYYNHNNWEFNDFNFQCMKSMYMIMVLYFLHGSIFIHFGVGLDRFEGLWHCFKLNSIPYTQYHTAYGSIRWMIIFIS